MAVCQADHSFLPPSFDRNLQRECDASIADMGVQQTPEERLRLRIVHEIDVVPVVVAVSTNYDDLKVSSRMQFQLIASPYAFEARPCE